MRAVAGDGNCGDCGGVARGFERLLAGEEADGEAGVECVACSSGVHGFYIERGRHLAEAVGGGEVGALRTHFDDDIFGAALEEKFGAARGCGGSDGFGGGKAAENARLAFVGRDPGGDLEQAGGQFARGSGIEHQRDIVAVGEGAESFESDERDFELREDHAGFAQQRGVRGDIFGKQLAVGAGDDDDVVLAIAANIDERDAGRTFHAADGIYADAGVAQSIFERGAERIVANISEHADGIAEPGDADGLVRAFAAVKRAEILADDGFAGKGT